MHELSLCDAIADAAIDHSAGRAVRRIELRIGHFRQVVPETLQFCWDLRNTGTVLEGCVLEVDHVPAVIECSACGATTALEAPVLRCGDCDSPEVALTSGDEFLIVSIDLASAAAREEGH